jgi:signal transduction histidine kinase
MSSYLALVAIGAAIAAISLLHGSTDPRHASAHAAYEYLYYLPVLLGAYQFGLAGGLLAAAAAALAYVPHIQATWAENAPYAASLYGQVVAFHLVGGLVGFLFSRQRRMTERYRHAAEALEIKNRELEHSQQQLRQAERLSTLGEIAAGLAHELRAPITAIGGALDILASRAAPQSADAEFSALARRELKRLSALLEDFLAYARPRPPHREPTDLAQTISQAAALLQSEAARRSVTLRVQSEGPATARVDSSQMTQVLLNLGLNAIQATREGGTVAISSTQNDGEVVMAVEDEGPGLPADASRIFEPFFTTKPKGSGLGLAVVHRIVTAHGGTVTLTSRQPTGARAEVRLPRSGKQ